MLLADGRVWADAVSSARRSHRTASALVRGSRASPRPTSQRNEVRRDLRAASLASSTWLASSSTRRDHPFAGSCEPVFLLHSTPKTMCSWRLVIPLLTPHDTVVCAGLQGLPGGSERPAGGY